mgnify:CR=1 FL=1
MKLSKIMIIEDDPVIQGELQTLLNGNGYTTLGVRNFSAVTEQIQDEKPHLILLDIKLPGENGFALCSKISYLFRSANHLCDNAATRIWTS